MGQLLGEQIRPGMGESAEINERIAWKPQHQWLYNPSGSVSGAP